MKRSWILAAALTTIVIAAVIGAVLVLGPPGFQRQRRFDERRIEDLTTIETYIQTYWSRHETLPPDLDTLDEEPGFQVPRRDPKTGEPYTYEPTGPRSYRLCTAFALDTAEHHPPRDEARWAHGAGRQCFKLQITEKDQSND